MEGIKIENLSFQYGNKKVLKNIDLEISRGMYGLLGRNGAGKTTLMKLITGLLPLKSGAITVEGVSVRNKRELRKVIGYLPQYFDFYPEMSVKEVLYYLGTLDYIPWPMLKKRTNELLQLVNLEEDSKTKVKALSGGMKRRLGIAQCLLNDPKIIIVDEPTAGLDPEERIRFRNLLGDLAEQKTVLLSTHITADIESSTRNLAILNQGEILYAGSVDELLSMTENYTYEGVVPREIFSQFKHQFHIYEQQESPDGMKVKILSGKNVGEDFKPVHPSLEAAYLNVLYGEGVRR